MGRSEPRLSRLPLVVQLGFAGSRSLLDVAAHPEIDQNDFETQIEALLKERLTKLRENLRLTDQHFICGISSLAIGADLIFTRTCKASGTPQRIFLPQTRDEFLKAQGASKPDFPEPSQRDAVVGLLESDHVIQERVVSDSSVRQERFEDVNREIVRVADLVICLVRTRAGSKTGGTEDLISRAVEDGKPTLVIEVTVVDGKPFLQEKWRGPASGDSLPGPFEAGFTLPHLPETIRGATLPEPAEAVASPARRYATAVKNVASPVSGAMRNNFRWTAIIIIGTHVLATILASSAMGFGPLLQEHTYRAILGLELLMLGAGMWVHTTLHRTHISLRWAEARLLAEVARSVLAIGQLHVYLSHLFTLPFPARIRSFLRTVNDLHLQSTRQDHTPWQQKRDVYVAQRLVEPLQNGQIQFYHRRAADAERRLRRANQAFIAFWCLAAFSTLLKLGFHHRLEGSPLLVGFLGTLAIVMPVLAAGALSLAGAMDLDAQEHTYIEMHEFLEKQVTRFTSARSERDYRNLVIETETRLLGETANWFSRRSFVTIA